MQRADTHPMVLNIYQTVAEINPQISNLEGAQKQKI
jgi:hypothetical protein